MKSVILKFDVGDEEIFSAGCKKFMTTYRDPWGLEVRAEEFSNSLVAFYEGREDKILIARLAGWFLCWKELCKSGEIKLDE